MAACELLFLFILFSGMPNCVQIILDLDMDSKELRITVGTTQLERVLKITVDRVTLAACMGGRDEKLSIREVLFREPVLEAPEVLTPPKCELEIVPDGTNGLLRHIEIAGDSVEVAYSSSSPRIDVTSLGEVPLAAEVSALSLLRYL